MGNVTSQGSVVAQPIPPTSGLKRALQRVTAGVRKVAEAAATPLLPEDFIDLIDPLRSGADLRGRVIDVRRETPTATTLTIRPGRGWRPHRPGQYTRIGVDVDGVRHWRAYSITSPVGGETITVTVRAIADGKVSNFVLNHLRLVTRFTRRDGILPVADLDGVVPDWSARHTWACGPTALLDDAEAHWTDAGLRDHLHTERFRPRIHAVGEGGAVTFTDAGVTVHADAATTLLDAGEDAGLLMPSGCRMGICFNCVLPMTEGSVRDLRTGELTTANPEDPVLVQTCVSAAAGPCHLTL